MLHVDIKRVEARGLGDLGDLDLPHQADNHRGDHLAAGELLLDAVVQDVADLRSHVSFLSSRYVSHSGRTRPATPTNAPSTSSATKSRAGSTGPGILACPLGMRLNPALP
jgi:hypothetical protein